MVGNVASKAIIGSAITGPMIRSSNFAPQHKNPTSTPEHANKAAKVIAGIVVGLIATAGLLVAGNKTGVLKNVGKYIPESIKNVGFIQKFKNPVKSVFANLDKAGGVLVENGAKALDKVKNSALFEKVKNVKVAEPIKETFTTIVEKGKDFIKQFKAGKVA